MLELFKDIDFA